MEYCVHVTFRFKNDLHFYSRTFAITDHLFHYIGSVRHKRFEATPHKSEAFECFVVCWLWGRQNCRSTGFAERVGEICLTLQHYHPRLSMLLENVNKGLVRLTYTRNPYPSSISAQDLTRVLVRKTIGKIPMKAGDFSHCIRKGSTIHGKLNCDTLFIVLSIIKYAVMVGAGTGYEANSRIRRLQWLHPCKPRVQKFFRFRDYRLVLRGTPFTSWCKHVEKWVVSNQNLWIVYFERMRAAVEYISVGLDIYRLSSGSTAQCQPTRMKTDRELVRLDADLTNLNNYDTKMSLTTQMHVMYRLMPWSAASAVTWTPLLNGCFIPDWGGFGAEMQMDRLIRKKASFAKHRLTSAVMGKIESCHTFSTKNTLQGAYKLSQISPSSI